MSVKSETVPPPTGGSTRARCESSSRVRVESFPPQTIDPKLTSALTNVALRQIVPSRKGVCLGLKLEKVRHLRTGFAGAPRRQGVEASGSARILYWIQPTTVFGSIAGESRNFKQHAPFGLPASPGAVPLISENPRRLLEAWWPFTSTTTAPTQDRRAGLYWENSIWRHCEKSHPFRNSCGRGILGRSISDWSLRKMGDFSRGL